MTKKLLFTVFLFLFFLSSLYGVIFEVNDLRKFEEEVGQLNSNALVLFDVDYTLIAPKDCSLKPCGRGLRRQFLFGLDPQRRELLQSIIVLEGQEELMDNAYPSLIKQIQKRNIPAIAFTALETGRYGKIALVEDWRINRLKNFDIDFSSTFLDKNPLILNECRPFRGHYPLFKNGVLFTNHQLKGGVLTAFLSRIGWKPNKILFIDDSIDQLKSVETACKALGIEFVGFHYIVAQTNPCEFDKKLGEFQFRNLVENEHWLTDAEATQALKQQACEFKAQEELNAIYK